MSTIRIISLSLLAVIQLGCFESFEDAIERENKVFTCDDGERSCITGYKCVSFTTPNGTERRCVRTEDLPADMTVPAPEMQMGQPDAGSDMSTEDAVVTDATLDMEVMDAAVPDMEGMDADIPDAQLVDACIPQLAPIEPDEPDSLGRCHEEFVTAVLNLCGLSNCGDSLMQNCRTIYRDNVDLAEERRMFNFIFTRVETLLNEGPGFTCGEVLGPYAKAFFSFVQNGLPQNDNSNGCTSIQSPLGLNSCEVGPASNSTILESASPSWTSGSDGSTIEWENAGGYTAPTSNQNSLLLTPGGKAKLKWAISLPPGVDVVSQVLVNLTYDSGLLISPIDPIEFSYMYTVQSETELCGPPNFRHGGESALGSVLGSDMLVSVRKTLSFGSGVTKAGEGDRRSELGVLKGGANYTITLEIEHDATSASTGDFTLELARTSIVPVTFFEETTSESSLIGNNCLPGTLNAANSVCEALTNGCTSANTAHCHTQQNDETCNQRTPALFAEDVFYSVFEMNGSTSPLAGGGASNTTYNCVTRTDCGHGVE